MKKFLLILIVMLAAFLRLYRLSDVPPGINRDEASIGYTAFSLMTTGRDEYGRSFPLSFESFGDWKLPLYIYTTIPLVKIFGLNELAVRLPSALAGIASLAATYYLARVLFASETIALLSAAVLAVSPWHIHISRVESEAIVAVFLTVMGSIWFLRRKLLLSSIFFAATYYTYHGNHISTSLLLVGIACIYWKEIIKIRRFWVAIVLQAIAIGIILSITLSADRTKISGISIFGDPTVVHTQIELPRLEHSNPNSLTSRLIHNRLMYAVVTIFQNYLKSYGPEFLFIKGGGNSAHNIQGYGNLHPIEAPLLLFGIIWLFVNIRSKHARFILWWIAVGAVAAAITKDAPHSNRMLVVVPALSIAIGGGIYYLWRLVPKQTHKILLVILVVSYLSCMAYYLDRYFVHFPKTEAANWGYAYKKLTHLLFSPEYVNKDIIMTKPETSPYIYLLFYSRYSPKDYQRWAKRYPVSSDGFTDVAGFERFSFRAIDWAADLSRHNTLLVVDADEVPSALSRQIVSTILLPDESSQFVVLDTGK